MPEAVNINIFTVGVDKFRHEEMNCGAKPINVCHTCIGKNIAINYSFAHE